MQNECIAQDATRVGIPCFLNEIIFSLISQRCSCLVAGAPFQQLPGVGKTAQPGANCPTLASFLISYTLKIELPELGKTQSGTARCGQLPTPATLKVRPCLVGAISLQNLYQNIPRQLI